MEAIPQKLVTFRGIRTNHGSYARYQRTT